MAKLVFDRFADQRQRQNTDGIRYKSHHGDINKIIMCHRKPHLRKRIHYASVFLGNKIAAAEEITTVKIIVLVPLDMEETTGR